ncbi:MAG: hypothetical protein VW707_07655, partial [Candidatus Puniceispirillum sp.]
AQMPVFYGASPLLSWIFVYYIRLYHVSLLPVGTVFLIGLIGDLLLSDVLGGRATAMILAIYVTDARRARLEQYDFGSLWFDFVLITCLQLMLTSRAQPFDLLSGTAFGHCG